MDKRSIGLVLVLVGLVSTASAATYMFTQTFQQVNITNAVITSNCSSLEPRTQTVVKGSSPNASYVLFNCPGNNKAFTVVQAPTIQATPTYILPSGYRNVSAVVFTSGATTCAGANFLTSGSVTTLASNSYNYCVGYDIRSFTGTSLSSFSITWSWNQ